MASGWFSVARIGEHSERVLISSFTAIVRRSRTFANFSSFGHAGPSLTSLGGHLSFFVCKPAPPNKGIIRQGVPLSSSWWKPLHTSLCQSAGRHWRGRVRLSPKKWEQKSPYGNHYYKCSQIRGHQKRNNYSRCSCWLSCQRHTTFWKIISTDHSSCNFRIPIFIPVGPGMSLIWEKL